MFPCLATFQPFNRMNTRKLTLLFTALVGLAVSAFAQSTATEATVARVTGTVTATLADGSTVAVTEGTKLPQGPTITTGDNSQAFLVSHGDTTSVIAANSVVEIAELSTTSAGGKVTEQKATLDLKSGNLVAKLNPAKKSVNQYAVRTPKGVAAARGTVFTMSYKGAKVTISVVNGVVSVVAPGLFNAGSGFWRASATGASTGEDNNVETVNAGEALSNDQATFNRSLGSKSVFRPSDTGEGADALAEANEIKELMALAVATVAVAAEKGIGGTTAADAAAVAKAVFAAVPSAAAQAAALMKQSGVTSTEVTAAVSNEVPTTEKSNFNSSLESGTFTQTTGTVTTSAGRFKENVSEKTETTTPQPIDPNTISRSN